MIELREASAADRDAILALRGRCFPVDDPEKRDPRFWDWEFRDGRMFVAADGARVVAHLGFVPMGDRNVRSVLAVDAMTDPNYRGQRLFARVAKFAHDAISAQVAFSGAWQIRKAVAGGIRAGGWEEAGGARVLIRPLVHAFGGDGAPTSDVQWMSELAPHRSAEWLRWRYFENPLWRYDVTATAGAWLVTRRTRLKGIDTLAVVDLAWRKRRDAAALLARALRTSKATLAATLVTPAHPAYGFFLLRGFLPGPHRFRFLVTHGVRARWALSWGDTDHL